MKGNKKDSGLYMEECEDQRTEVKMENSGNKNDYVKAGDKKTELVGEKPKAQNKKSKKQINKSKRSKQKYIPIMSIANY